VAALGLQALVDKRDRKENPLLGPGEGMAYQGSTAGPGRRVSEVSWATGEHQETHWREPLVRLVQWGMQARRGGTDLLV